MATGSAILEQLKTVAVPLIVLAALALLRKLSNLQKPQVVGDLMIFPVGWFSKVIGLIGVVGGGAAAYWFVTAKSVSWWYFLLICCIGLCGVWMSVGEFRLNSSHIEKRILWVRETLLWTEVREIDESPGGSTLYGETTKFWVEPWYVGYARLLQEIHERVPHLKVREKSKWKKRLGW